MYKLIVLIICILLLVIIKVGWKKNNNVNSSVEYDIVEMSIDESVIDSNDVFQIIEPLWWSVSIYDGEKRYNEDLAKFTDAQKYVFAIQWYLSEVNNGGHDQFYFNSTGIVWEDALKGFEVIGLKENYDILKQSAERLGGNPSKDRSKRQKELDKNELGFDDLDDRLYESEQNIDETLLKYIKENRDEYLFKGKVKKPR